jgi:hypothetical protein
MSALIPWKRLNWIADQTGYVVATLRDWCREGTLERGKVWKYDGKGLIVIHAVRFNDWIENNEVPSTRGRKKVA